MYEHILNMRKPSLYCGNQIIVGMLYILYNHILLSCKFVVIKN